METGEQRYPSRKRCPHSNIPGLRRQDTSVTRPFSGAREPVCSLPAGGLLTMFLVSWSLFSRLSRIKDSVSSSCEERRGGHQHTPTVKGDHHHPARRPTLTPPPLNPGSMPLRALPSLSPWLHLLQLVLDLPPPSGSLLRGNHRSGQRCSHSPLSQLQTLLGSKPFSASVPATPTSSLGPAPGSSGGAMLGVADGSVCLPACERAEGRRHLECGWKSCSPEA